MIKLIVFDLDGTLVDSRDLHYQSFIRAIDEVNPEYTITHDEHQSTYDGLPTTKKLELLTKHKGLPRELYSKIWDLKQKYTQSIILESYTPDHRVCEILKSLKSLGYLVYIASNCVWKNLALIASRKGFLDHIDWMISNEEVRNPKPSPEMYLSCMLHAQVGPQETIIIEDSPIGKKSALLSGAHLLPVACPNDLTLSKVVEMIEKVQKMSLPVEALVKWQKPLTVIIPMAGLGSRFAKAGYSFPKPLIDVFGRTMIEVVVRNLNLDLSITTFIFVVRKQHYHDYDLKNLLDSIVPGCKIQIQEGDTEGATCSVLSAKELIDNDKPLLIANSDQFVEWNSSEFLYQMESADGGMATFESSHPKWSYAKLREDGFVSEVAEKKVISNHATVGIYYYKKGGEFIKYAEQMIKKGIKVNGEYYVCPIYNEYIQDGKKIKIANIQRMWGIGVPEDLDYFLNNYKGSI